MKILYVVLDGAADGPSAPRLSLEEASKPNIDELASNALCGMVYPIAPGVAPESDAAVMALLGYDPEKYYTGRGVLEAIGAGMEFRNGWVAFRANYATIDAGTRRIIDRRVGRSLTSREARELAAALDGMELGGGEARARFKATIGHRGVLILVHKERLSAMVSNSDPAYERRGNISVAKRDFEPYIARIEPLEDTREARLTAELANEFTERAIEILDSHPVNEERRAKGLPPANAVLLRDASDKLPPVKPLSEVYGIRMASIVEMVVERGIARILGLADIPVEIEGLSKREILEREARLTLEALERYDGVYVHLKGPDEPGHDGDLEGKIKAIEEIDRYFFGRILDGLDREGTLIIVTSDHATPWNIRAHSGDPVPLMFSNPGIPRGPGAFDEKTCTNGELGVLVGAYRILSQALNLMRKIGR